METVFTDTDDCWIDLSHKLIWINNNNNFIYLSEYYGWRQIFVVDKNKKIGIIIILIFIIIILEKLYL